MFPLCLLADVSDPELGNLDVAVWRGTKHSPISISSQLATKSMCADQIADRDERLAPGRNLTDKLQTPETNFDAFLSEPQIAVACVWLKVVF